MLSFHCAAKAADKFNARTHVDAFVYYIYRKNMKTKSASAKTLNTCIHREHRHTPTLVFNKSKISSVNFTLNSNDLCLSVCLLCIRMSFVVKCAHFTRIPFVHVDMKVSLVSSFSVCSFLSVQKKNNTKHHHFCHLNKMKRDEKKNRSVLYRSIKILL